MQKKIILESEADAWFLRNKEYLLKKKDFPHMENLTKYIKNEDNVLEIGSSFGYNLNFLCKKTGCHGFGIEPSEKAITLGTQLFPHLSFTKGTIDDVNIFEKKFDHIIIGFCLYLVDEELLPEMVYKINKILKNGGFIHILDFDSKYPTENSYGHDSRIKTRKMDYSSLFTAFPFYTLVEKQAWSHIDLTFHPDKKERCSTHTVYKEFIL